MTRVTRRALPLVLLALAGCASRRMPQNHIPASRRFESSLLHRSHNRTCALTIMTEAGGDGTGLSLYLDGNQLARIKAGEALTVYLTPR